jgi:hypothetical protein
MEPSATSSEAATPSQSSDGQLPECDEGEEGLQSRGFDDEDDLEEMWVYEDEVPEGWVIVDDE